MRFSLDDRSPSVKFEDLVALAFEALAEVPDVSIAVERSTGLCGGAGGQHTL